MDRRAEELDATRRHLLDAVIDVAADSGLEALTINAVAARADVAVRTIYNHYETRESLIAAAMGSLAESTRATVQSIVVPDDPPKKQLASFVETYLRSYEGQGQAIQVLMAASALLPEVAASVQDVRTWRRDRLRAIIRRLHLTGTGRHRLSLNDSVNVAYTLTAYSTYSTLTVDLGLSPAAARTTVLRLLDAAL